MELSNLSKKELLLKCKQKNIKNYSSKNKNDLIKLLEDIELDNDYTNNIDIDNNIINLLENIKLKDNNEIILNSINQEIKEEQIVLISGIRSTEFDKEDKVVYSETRYGNFMRRVKLPDLVNESFTHFYTDGVLYLTFKKKYDNNITFNESVNKSENWADII